MLDHGISCLCWPLTCWLRPVESEMKLWSFLWASHSDFGLNIGRTSTLEDGGPVGLHGNWTFHSRALWLCGQWGRPPAMGCLVNAAQHVKGNQEDLIWFYPLQNSALGSVFGLAKSSFPIPVYTDIAHRRLPKCSRLLQTCRRYMIYCEFGQNNQKYLKHYTLDISYF